MVPVIFRNLLERELAAVLGFISAFAAYGGFFIPKAYGSSIDLADGVAAAVLSTE